jgi:tetratricopeptide (TPR) repeat protein
VNEILFEHHGRRGAPISVSALLLVSFLIVGCTTVEERRQEAKGPGFNESMARFNYEMSEKLWKQGKEDLAVKYLMKAVSDNPMMLEPRLGLMDIYISRGAYRDVVVFAENCPEGLKSHPEILERLVFALEADGNPEALAQVVENAAAAGIPPGRFLSARAEADLMNKDYEGALDLYRQACENDPADVRALMAMAKTHELLGNHDQECEILLRIATICPDDPAAAMNVALAFERAGCRQDGIASLKNLLLTGENNLVRDDVCRALGYLYFKEEMWQDAVKIYSLVREKGLSLLLRDDRMRLAESLLRIEDDAKAAAELQKLLDDDPADTVVRAALGLAYWRSGQTSRAREIMENAPRGVEGGTVLNALSKQFKSSSAD